MCRNEKMKGKASGSCYPTVAERKQGKAFRREGQGLMLAYRRVFFGGEEWRKWDETEYKSTRFRTGTGKESHTEKESANLRGLLGRQTLKKCFRRQIAIKDRSHYSGQQSPQGNQQPEGGAVVLHQPILSQPG